MQIIFIAGIFMIIDTHCHIYASEMENAEEIINEAAKKDIHMILNGTDPLSNLEVLGLAEKYENVHAALGYLYTFADDVTDDDISLLDEQLENENVIAVGEIGLDYYYTKDNRDRQIKLFEKMLCLAEKHGLPVIVHSRKSMQDTYDILKMHNVRGSMHCYLGSAEMAQQFIKLGFCIGIAGPITHTNNKKTKKMAKNIDISHILVETDSPYLTPVPHRGQRNESAYIPHIASRLAQIKETGIEEIAEITTGNAEKLFGI